MLGNKKVVLEIGNQYLLKKEAKELDKKKKKLISQIVRKEKRVNYLSELLDKGEPSLPFFLTRSSVANEIVSERKELYILKTELKKVEMKRKTIVVDSEGKLRYESYVLITQDRCYLEEIAKGCLRDD